MIIKKNSSASVWRAHSVAQTPDWMVLVNCFFPWRSYWMEKLREIFLFLQCCRLLQEYLWREADTKQIEHGACSWLLTVAEQPVPIPVQLVSCKPSFCVNHALVLWCMGNWNPKFSLTCLFQLVEWRAPHSHALTN